MTTLGGSKRKRIWPRSVSKCLPSGEKLTALTQLEWPFSVLRQNPVAVSHSRTVPSSDADATSVPSGEKLTAVTQSEWPSSVWSKELHSSCHLDNLFTHSGEWSLNVFRNVQFSEAKTKPEEYIWSGESSNTGRIHKVTRFVSRRKAEDLALDFGCIAG